MFKCIHGLTPNYLRNDVTMYVDINGYDTRSSEIWIYTCHVSSRTFIREVLVIRLPIYGISYLPMLNSQQLLIYLNKIISIRKVGWNNVARPESTHHRCTVYSYICTRFITFTLLKCQCSPFIFYFSIYCYKSWRFLSILYTGVYDIL